MTHATLISVFLSSYVFKNKKVIFSINTAQKEEETKHQIN